MNDTSSYYLDAFPSLHTEATELLTKSISVQKKASQINADSRIFGAFAEIGAGQKVARHFFRTAGASNTVAKTISAYEHDF